MDLLNSENELKYKRIQISESQYFVKTVKTYEAKIAH
jgi:hypothetical protein